MRGYHTLHATKALKFYFVMAAVESGKRACAVSALKCSLNPMNVRLAPPPQHEGARKSA